MAVAGKSGVKVEVEPLECLHDVLPSMKVTGLHPDAPVTLTLTTHDDAGYKYFSHAHYRSNVSGTVDVGSSEAVGGDFMGVFPEGLFSTLQQFPFHYRRMQKKDVTRPWKMTLAAHEGHLSQEEAASREAWRSLGGGATMQRALMGPGVRRVQVRHGRVRGALFLPQGPGPHPAVMDVFGGFGGLQEYRASMLASRGFAALALAVFGYDDLPKTSSHIELDYLEEAVDHLLSQPEVIPDRCGILASSLGACFSVPCAVHLEKVKAVILVGGVPVASHTTLTYKGKQLWQGEKPSFWNSGIDKKLRIHPFRESQAKKLFQPDNPKLLPIEQAPDDTHFLFLAGDQDTAQAAYGARALEQRLKQHRKGHLCRTIIYPGAGHIIEPPYNTASLHSCYQIPLPFGFSTSIVIYWGGEALGNCRAQEDYWHQVRSFFTSHVKEGSEWYQQYLQGAEKEEA